MPENLITLPEWEVREWKARLLFGLIMNPLTAVAVTAALAEFTAARCARRPPAESKEKTPTSSLDDTESEKIPTNPPVTKKLSDAARKRQAYERRMEQRRRKEETEPKSKPRKEKAKRKPTPRKSPLSRENPPGPNKPVVLHNDDDMSAIADLLGEPQDHYSGSPQRSDEPKAIPLSNSLEEKTTQNTGEAMRIQLFFPFRNQ